MNYLNKETPERHPHADLIIQWANNPKIEIEFFNSSEDSWQPINNPSWDVFLKYRIKPEPKPDVIVYTCIGKDGNAHHSSGCWTQEMEPLSSNFNGQFLSEHTLYKVVTKLKLTYDGETGKLKEVVEI